MTLPRCVELARAGRRSLQMRLEIRDPTDDAVCERYESFRRSLSTAPDGTGEAWTRGRARLESYATIVAACWYRERFQLLDIHVGLSSTMSTFRYDMSSEYLVVTQDDARFPALLIPRGKPLYDGYDVDLRNSFDQTRAVRLELSGSVSLSETPTPAEIRRLLEALNLFPDQLLDEQELQAIAEKAVHAKNPYS